jgi:hypothetical protein
MGFRENLKTELAYADMPVRELAALSGVKKQTIDSYAKLFAPRYAKPCKRGIL